MITNKTRVEDLSFPNAWRLKRSANHYNRAVDKKERIETVKDLLEKRDQLIDLFGVGPKTFSYLYDHLNEAGL